MRRRKGARVTFHTQNHEKFCPIKMNLSKRYVCMYQSEGVYAILLEASGVVYFNQTYGHICFQSQEEGILVPFNSDFPLEHPEQRLEQQFASLFEKHHRFSEKLADKVDEILAFDCFTRCAKVDRRKLKQSHEAWIYVIINNEAPNSPLSQFSEQSEAVLTWQNSD